MIHDLISLGCLNTDGLTGYSFSHEGFWSNGSVPKGMKESAKKCADECDQENKCIAFNYRYHDDNADDNNDNCYVYHSLGSKEFDTGFSRAYDKCTGMSEQSLEPHYIYRSLYL